MRVTERPLKVVLTYWQEVPEFHEALSGPIELVKAPTPRDEDVAPLMPGADAIMTGRFSAAMAAQADSLRLIQTPGAGTNMIDLAAVPPQTTVCNVYGHERGIAEYIFTTMSMLNRDFLGMDRRLRSGLWSDHFRGALPELQGKTIAVIGLGRIGAEVAQLARYLRMRVIAATRNPDPARATEIGVSEVAGMDQLHRILGQADFVGLCVPLTPETTRLIDRDALAAMKPTAYLINVARGEVIEEEPFYEALRDKTIAGAAIDVWFKYPDKLQEFHPSNFPFRELDNVVMTPHIAGATDATFDHRWKLINQNFQSLRTGAPFANVVKPAAG
jgi:phosphoglycerate dehydrogenase-like enzyme